MRNLDKLHKRTIQIYNNHAHGWDEHRPRVLFEKQWLDKFIGLLPTRAQILDVGCGAGDPIAKYFLEQGFSVTGVDGSANMIEICSSRFPEANWIKTDMRELALGSTFDGIISWDASFHLNQEEQRQVLLTFANHLSDTGVLLLTIGHEAGEVTGTVEGEQVYHSILEPDEYVSILGSLGFDDIEIELEDESCGFHSLLLAKRNG